VSRERRTQTRLSLVRRLDVRRLPIPCGPREERVPATTAMRRVQAPVADGRRPWSRSFRAGASSAWF